MKVDGIVGPETLTQLNVPVEQRLKQLVVNLNRISAFPGISDEEYVYVNIPEFRLRYVDRGTVRLKNKVVVGKPYWQTPSMSDVIEKFVINPTWKIPLSIATKEIAPKAAKDPDYFEKADIEIRKDSYVDTETIDPNQINWQEVTPYDFDYFLVKRAGEENPLGEIKYLFPNKEAIYVHDTPAKNWFERPLRAASHGCIRMEQPFSLAQSIARHTNRQKLLDTIEEVRQSGKTQTFYLEKPLPIHLVYWTAWVDETDQVNFRRDIYDRDSAPLAKLEAGPEIYSNFINPLANEPADLGNIQNGN
ncbi:hypothetical protein GCM10009114_01100 [Aliiglaciecola litoralis]|uniref:L,D-TPase catalytic domain-containing protein n=1 Tax=Aliiglaciecola litoralis TaxID=582857 RepID=A0ABN1LBU8_9ALTE